MSHCKKFIAAIEKIIGGWGGFLQAKYPSKMKNKYKLNYYFPIKCITSMITIIPFLFEIFHLIFKIKLLQKINNS